jgi:hypothetical protein
MYGTASDIPRHGRTWKSRTSLRLWLLTLVLLGCVGSWPSIANAAPNKAVPVSITVSVRAKWIATPRTPSVPPYFAADLDTIQITVDVPGYPEIATQIENELTGRVNLAKSGSPSDLKAVGITKTPDSDWIVVPRGERNEDFHPPNTLLQTLLVYKNRTVQFLTPPKPGLEGTPVTITLKAVSATIYPLDTISIVVSTNGSGSEAVSNLTLRQLWPNLPKVAPEGSIPIEVHYFTSSCAQLTPRELAQRVGTVAARLYEQLYDNGLTLHSYDLKPSPYNSMIQAWAKSISITPASALWDPLAGKLELSTLDVVYGISVLPTSGDDETFKPLQEHLAKMACNQLFGLPLNDQGKQMFEYLASQDRGVKTANANYVNGALQLTVTPQPRLVDLLFSGGASYNNATGVVGKLSATGQDLVPMKRLYYLSNTFQMSYQGGGSYQNASSSWSVTKASRDPLPKLEFYSFALGGDFIQNQNDRFGAEVLNQILTVNETQAIAGLKLSYDSFSIFDISDANNQAPPARKLNRHQIVVPINFMFEKFTASSNQGSYHSSGNILQFSASPDYLYTHDFDSVGKTKGWSELDIEASAEYIEGVAAAGGYFGFNRYLGSTTASGFFGLRRTRQFLLLGQYGVGSLSAGGPIVRVFQLGGNQWVPGLQLGEFAGQTLAFCQAEMGIDMPSVFELFKRTVPSSTKFFDVRRSYVKFEYSRASVSQGESVRAVAGLASGPESFGPALELGRLENQFDLTAGYMYSPQSTVHPHGTFFLSIHISDLRMR